MNKLAIIIPFYQREQITKLCFKHLAEQQKKFKFDVFVSGDNKSIVPKSFKFVEHDNDFLSNKLNNLLSKCKSYDGVLILGSDDFISDSIFKLYQTINTKDLVFYGFDDCHIYSVWNNKLGNDFAYSRSGNTIGVARLWTKQTLEHMNYKIWSDNKPKGLDSDSKSNMINKGVKEVSLSYDGHFILDVKHEQNITSPEIVNTSNNYNDPIMIIAELGKIGNEILELEKAETKNIYKMEKKIELGKVKFVSNGSFFAAGFYQMDELKAKSLELKGYGNIEIQESKPKAKRTTKK